MAVSRIIFDKYDTDSDGSITKDQFQSLSYNLGHHLEGETLEAAWVVLDSNGNGTVSFDEFLSKLLLRLFYFSIFFISYYIFWLGWWRKDDRWGSLELTEEQIQLLNQVHDIFRGYDTDNSGQLEKEEFRNCYVGLIDAGIQLGDFEEAFEQLDSERNGVIDYNEFVRWLVNAGVLTLER